MGDMFSKKLTVLEQERQAMRVELARQQNEFQASLQARAVVVSVLAALCRSDPPRRSAQGGPPRVRFVGPQRAEEGPPQPHRRRRPPLRPVLPAAARPAPAWEFRCDRAWHTLSRTVFLSVSPINSFAGEDLSAAERKKRQLQQQAAWCQDQVRQDQCPRLDCASG